MMRTMAWRQRLLMTRRQRLLMTRRTTIRTQTTTQRTTEHLLFSALYASARATCLCYLLCLCYLPVLLASAMPMLSADAIFCYTNAMPMPMLCQCYADAIYAAHAPITFNI